MEFQIGPIRPPSEANSLLLRVTENCPWNKCKFCMLYKTKQFHTRTVEEIKKDIDAMAYYRDEIQKYNHNGTFDIPAIQKEFDNLPTNSQKECYYMVFHWITEGNCQAIFLQDANTLVLKIEWLTEIIKYIRQKLPEIKRITSYARADTLCRITEEQFLQLKSAGLNRIHSGFETGCDEVLQLIGKGTTQKQQIEGGKKVKQAGIELSIYFMPGAGGKQYSEKNAIDTATVINAINPDFVRLRTFVVKNGSLMHDLVKSGEFIECSDMEKLLEIKMMLEHIQHCNGYLASDHIINLLQNVNGYLDKDKNTMLDYINTFLALPRKTQRKYQIARRMGFAGDWTMLDKLSMHYQYTIEQYEKNVPDGEQFEMLLNQYMDNYI